jgi:hypothetical protein
MAQKSPAAAILIRALAIAAVALITASCLETDVRPPVDIDRPVTDDEDENRPIFLGKPPVVINEICPTNAGYRDDFNELPGWVEFYNSADTSVNLNGYYLTSSVNRKMFVFEDVVVAPRGYLVVFMAGMNQSSGNIVYATFELGKKGGELFLMDSDGHIRDSITYPAEILGLSYARNESGGWAFSKPPTPNESNSSEVYDGQTSPPQAGIPQSGYYADSLVFTLPPETDAGIICCDTTGQIPTIQNELRSGVTLTLKRTAVLRCAMFKANKYPSEPVMRTYIINDNLLGDGGKRIPTLPVISIAVDPVAMFDSVDGLYSTGLYANSEEPHYGANYWKDTELSIQIDFFENGMKHVWSYPAGVRIFGNWSRIYPKKSLLISFRESYGHNNLRYPLFPDFPHLTKFKHFVLRNNGNNYGRDYIRDMLMTSLTKGLDIEYQKGRHVIVYLNGRYYGIYDLRERSNNNYFDTNYGINPSLIDLVKANNEVSSGSDADYQNIVRWLETVTVDDENLKILGERIDVENYTNVMQSEMYFGNTDWPGNNMKHWRSNSPPSKWRWFIYDTDFGFDYRYSNAGSINIFEFATNPDGPNWPNPPHSTFLIRKLLENENYKNAFINRFSLLLAAHYTPEKVDARINELMAPIDAEIQLDRSRWSISSSTINMELDKIKNWGRNRPTKMQNDMEDFFGLDNGVDFTVSTRGNGNVFVHNLQVMNADRGVTFKAYASIPVMITAVPNSGSVFSGWSDGVASAKRTVTIEKPTTLEAKFEPTSF